jgi:hypothetical protein
LIESANARVFSLLIYPRIDSREFRPAQAVDGSTLIDERWVSQSPINA